MGPLSGVKVIEFAGIGAAPFCAMVLSDLGADVIRVDRVPPSQPDRVKGPVDGIDDGPADGIPALSEGIMGRGRRSVALDLKHPDGTATALDLISDADALIEGFRPGVMERLGLGPQPCLVRNPRVVYGRLTGWGQHGPYAHSAGHDLNYIALAGALAPIGRRGEAPVPPLNLLGDFAGGGLLLAMGIAAALVEAGRSGHGQVVDAAMADGSAYLMAMMYELLGRGRWVQEREANPNDGGAPFYHVYETSDGEYVSVAAMEPRFWAELLDRIGLAGEDLPAQWDRAGWPELTQRLAAVFRSRSRDEWCELLEGTDACFAPVLRMSEALVHPHNVARGTFTARGSVAQPAPAPRFSRTPGIAGREAARPGEHTDKILAAYGFSAERIAALRQSGAIG